MPEPQVIDELIDGVIRRMRGRKIVSQSTNDLILDMPAEKQAVIRMLVWEKDLAGAGYDPTPRRELSELAPDLKPDVIENFVGQMGNPCAANRMIITGTVGAGKTTAAIGAGYLALAHQWWARFINHSTYLDMLRPGRLSTDEANIFKGKFRTTDLLVLDGLGENMFKEIRNRDGSSDFSSDTTLWVQEQTMSLVNDRLSSNKATIFTTNLDATKMRTVIGGACLSRISGEATIISTKGTDRRKPARW